MNFNWDSKKNDILKNTRGVSFLDVVEAVREKRVIDILDGSEKYPNQKRLIVLIHNYPHVVPFKIMDDEVFLITIFPSRVLKNKYLKGDDNG